MSLSDLFKPWNWFWFACGPPLPNVALVLQYLQALRVSSDAIIKKKKNPKEKYFFFFFCARAKNFKLSCSPVAVQSASRAPLAERSAVNRQVPGSIPGGGEFFFSAKNNFENISRCQNVFIDALGAGATHSCAFKKKKKKK